MTLLDYGAFAAEALIVRLNNQYQRTLSTSTHKRIGSHLLIDSLAASRGEAGKLRSKLGVRALQLSEGGPPKSN
jgi:hypothetical protein